jgi:hypothetical protein
MDGPTRRKTLTETINSRLDGCWDDLADDLAREQYKDFENGALDSLGIWMALGERAMAETLVVLAAKDEGQAKRLAGKFLGREELARRLEPAVINYLRNSCGATIPSPESAKGIVPGPEPVVIDLDKGESESTAMPDVGERSSTTGRSRTQVSRLPGTLLGLGDLTRPKISDRPDPRQRLGRAPSPPQENAGRQPSAKRRGIPRANAHLSSFLHLSSYPRTPTRRFQAGRDRSLR